MSLGNGFHQVNKVAKSRLGLGAIAADAGFNAIGYRMGGDSWSTSALKGLTEGAFFAFAPGLAITTQIGMPAVKGLTKLGFSTDKRIKDTRTAQMRPGTGFTYRDSRAALTMRQAAVQAIQGSKLNARNALGGEASLMHRSYVRK